jgi:hypothetical protein
MNGTNYILEELRSLSELVATISRQTPYQVSADYFTDLSARVLLRVKTQHKPLTFNVPEGYFEDFAQGVLARIKAGAGKDSGFSPREEPSQGVASQGVAFGGVETELAALSPLLAQVRHILPYQAPEGYFEELSPVLTIARGKNPYTVPEEYFHHLPVEIEAKLAEGIEKKAEEEKVEKKQARIVAFGRRRANWWKYSAAAVMAGFVLSIGWLRLHVSGRDHQGTSIDIAVGLPRVSDQELQSFLADQDTTLAQPTSNLAPAGSIASMEFNEGDLRSLLGDVPDGELKQYMEEHGGANDIATN